jgi:hypothetical protein
LSRVATHYQGILQRQQARRSAPGLVDIAVAVTRQPGSGADEAVAVERR